jgi:hypothetical protein
MVGAVYQGFQNGSPFHIDGGMLRMGEPCEMMANEQRNNAPYVD